MSENDSAVQRSTTSTFKSITTFSHEIIISILKWCIYTDHFVTDRSVRVSVKLRTWIAAVNASFRDCFKQISDAARSFTAHSITLVDVSALFKPSQVTQLQIEHNKDLDLRVLQVLSNLEVLELVNVKAGSFSALSQLKELNHLALNNVSTLKNLYCTVRWNPDPKPDSVYLEDMPNISTLSVLNCVNLLHVCLHTIRDNIQHAFGYNLEVLEVYNTTSRSPKTQLQASRCGPFDKLKQLTIQSPAFKMLSSFLWWLENILVANQHRVEVLTICSSKCELVVEKYSNGLEEMLLKYVKVPLRCIRFCSDKDSSHCYLSHEYEDVP